MSEQEPEKVLPDTQEVQAMLATAHVLRELMVALANYSSAENTAAIQMKIEELKKRDVSEEQIRLQIVEWQRINRVTTESEEFERNAAQTLATLTEPAPTGTREDLDQPGDETPPSLGGPVVH